MLCGWGVNAGMAYLQVKLCVAISERFGNAIVLKGALRNIQVYRTLLYFRTIVYWCIRIIEV